MILTNEPRMEPPTHALNMRSCEDDDEMILYLLPFGRKECIYAFENVNVLSDFREFSQAQEQVILDIAERKVFQQTNKAEMET